MTTSEFESRIPHNMRFKQFDSLDNGELYWVTQEFFDLADLQTFAKSLGEFGYDKAYVTTRDFSGYDFDEDLARDVFAIAYSDGTCDIEDYANEFYRTYPDYYEEYFGERVISEDDREHLARQYVDDYRNYKFDLEELHDRLYKLFGSYKDAVTWFAENW